MVDLARKHRLEAMGVLGAPGSGEAEGGGAEEEGAQGAKEAEGGRAEVIIQSADGEHGSLTRITFIASLRMPDPIDTSHGEGDVADGTARPMTPTARRLSGCLRLLGGSLRLGAFAAQAASRPPTYVMLILLILIILLFVRFLSF